MKRKEFIQQITATSMILTGLKLNALEKITDSFSKSDKMPVLFVGHGHPMNALFDNDFTQSLQKIAKKIERPNAIMVVSAHWETKGTYVSVNPAPKAIYDFGNFDSRLFDIKYEPQGHPQLARELIQEDPEIMEDTRMGLDHGAWTVLKYIYPNADVPVFELSMDYTKGPAYHFELAQAMKKMREKGVLILGSGNIVHNLGKLDWNNINASAPDWAVEFDTLVKNKLDTKDYLPLIQYEILGRAALMSIPTNEHYLPFLYTLGLADEKEEIKYLFEGFQYGGISMRCFLIS